jgi:hypothetical protein
MRPSHQAISSVINGNNYYFRESFQLLLSPVVWLGLTWTFGTSSKVRGSGGDSCSGSCRWCQMFALSTIEVINRRLESGEVCFQTLRRCIKKIERSVRNLEALQVCSEHRRDRRMFFETNMQEFIHIAVSLQDIPSRSSDTMRLRTLLNSCCTMLHQFPKLTMNLTQDGTEYHESLRRRGLPILILTFRADVVDGSDHHLRELARTL